MSYLKNKKIIIASVLSLTMLLTSVTTPNLINNQISTVYAATEKEATDIEITTTSDVILYAADTTASTHILKGANTEYLETTILGGTAFKKMEFSFEAKNMNGEKVSDCFIVKEDNDKELSFNLGKSIVTLNNNKNGIPKFYVTAGNGFSEGATLEVTVTMWLTKRENPMVRRCVFTLDKGLTLPTAIEAKATRDIIRTDVESKISMEKQPTDCNATGFYTITKDGKEVKDVLKGKIHTLQSTDGKIEYATFNEDTGIFKATVPGIYEIIPVVSAFSGKVTTKKINVVDLSFDNICLEMGRTVTRKDFVYDKMQGLNANNATVTYKVANEDIATVEVSDNAYGSNITVTGIKAGFTKITATVKSTEKDVDYYLTKEAYIVVAPKSSDKTFAITNAIGTNGREAYINELVEANRGNIVVLRSALNEILEGKLDTSKLSKQAIERIQGTLEADYPYYYSEKIDNKVSGVTVSTDGLTLAFASSKVLSKKDPLNAAKIVMTCNQTKSSDNKYIVKNSIINISPSFTRYGNSAKLDRAIWVTLKSTSLKNGEKYIVYNNKNKVCTVTAKNNQISFVYAKEGVISVVKSVTQQVDDTNMSAWLVGKETNNGSVIAGGDDDNMNDSSNGESSDSSGGDKEEGSDNNEIAPALDLRFIGFVQDEGLKNAELDTSTGIVSLGTHGKSRRFESLIIYGIDKDNIKATAHIQNRGDVTGYKYDESGGIPIGDSGSGLRMEAISLELLNNYGKFYDIYYRVHVQNYGWLGWAKNGEVAGTSGHSFRIEGIEIAIVKKGEVFDTSKYVKTYEQGNRGMDAKASYMDRQK